MTQPTRTSLYATVAISAALAFGSTSALGQDAAAPVIQLPPASPPAAAPAAPAPQPVIVLPETTAPAAEAPAAEPAPRADRPTARTAPRRADPAPASRTAVADSTAAPAETAAPETGIDMLPPVAIPLPEAAQVDVPPADARADSVQSSVDFPDELIGAVGLGILALGGIALVNLRRRRRKRLALADEVYEPVTSIPDELSIHSQQLAFATSPTSDGDAFAMPEGSVPTGEARQRLLDAMVAAPPDEANPFTSLRARRKRARIILQSREHRLDRQASEPFDWRTYRSPATPDPANPPMVDA